MCIWETAPEDSSQCTGSYCCGGMVSTRSRCELNQAAWNSYCPNQMPADRACPCAAEVCQGQAAATPTLSCVGGECGLRCPPSGGDGGPDASVAEDAQDEGTPAPLFHRPTGTTCPAARAPGANICNCAGAPGVCAPCAPPGGCAEDSDCTAGINGRCLDEGPLPNMQCSYDDCFSDVDCPAHTPCNCRDSASSSTPNSCLTGSNCRVDSDCGPGGFCSPSQPSWNELTYDCHTASDTCLNDSECASNQGCVFGQAGYWSCAVIPPPPP